MTMKHIRKAAGVCLTATLLAACGGNGAGGSAGATNGPAAGKNYVDGATFTMAMTSDPGSLDPQMSVSSDLLQLAAFAYDSLLSTAKDGSLVSELAKDWKVDGTTVTMTVKEGISCSDGTPFTADDAAANINFMSNPDNKSALLGVFVPAGARATSSGSTLSVKLPAAAPFSLEGLAGAPMVCKSGLADRKTLEKATAGTGPYVLKEAVPGDHFTFTKREGYTWGPDGATTSEKGMPAVVTVKVIPNETTAANLLLSGGLNAARVKGQDVARLKAANLFSSEVNSISGELWFNHADERPGADAAVRKAIAQATDFGKVRDVLTSKMGSAPTTFAVYPPVTCPGDSISAAIPTGGLEAAKATLDAAGWKIGADGTRTKDGRALEMSFIYQAETGAPEAAAAELAGGAWKQLGIKLTMKAQDHTARLQSLYGSGDWDVAWAPLNVSTPDQLVPFLSGPTIPKGNNFSHIDNKAYTEMVTKAAKEVGKDSCPDWLSAESNLVKDADVIPFAILATKTWGKQAEFGSGSSDILPVSIRMLAN